MFSCDMLKRSVFLFTFLLALLCFVSILVFFTWVDRTVIPFQDNQRHMNFHLVTFLDKPFILMFICKRKGSNQQALSLAKDWKQKKVCLSNSHDFLVIFW